MASAENTPHRLTFRYPAPDWSVFGPDTFDGVVGAKIRLDAGALTAYGIIESVEVVDEGRVAVLSILVPPMFGACFDAHANECSVGHGQR